MNGNGNGTVTVIESQAEEQLKQELAQVVARAQELVVITAKDYSVAADLLKLIKERQSRVKDYYKPRKDLSYRRWKQDCADEQTFLKPLESAESTIKGAMSRYMVEEERKAEAERLRLQAEEDARARKEQERLEARAQKAAEKGDVEKAQALVDEAANVQAAAVHVEPAAPKVGGISMRKQWKAEVTDKRAFLKFCIEEPTGTFIECVDIVVTSLERMAKGDKAPTVPGVRYFSKMIVSSGSR